MPTIIQAFALIFLKIWYYLSFIFKGLPVKCSPQIPLLKVIDRFCKLMVINYKSLLSHTCFIIWNLYLKSRVVFRNSCFCSGIKKYRRAQFFLKILMEGWNPKPNMHYTIARLSISKKIFIPYCNLNLNVIWIVIFLCNLSLIFVYHQYKICL